METHVGAECVAVRGSCRIRFDVCVGVVVVNGGQSMTLLSERADCTDIGSHPHCISSLASCCYENIRSLADTKRDHIGFIGLDGYKIVGDDSHFMVINGKSLQSLSSSID